jgi:hypothetical protein
MHLRRVTRTMSLVVSLTASLVLVAACAGQDEPTAESAADAPQVAEPAATPATEAPSDTSGAALPTASASSGVTALPAGQPSPVGYDSIRLTLTKPDGTVCEVCAWLAATPEQQARGLMGVTGLGAAEAMLFQFEGPTTGEFWMVDTIIPLSIAFYDESLAYVSQADMQPCTATDALACERYGASGPYRYAVEVAAGRLAELGFVPGSTMALGELGCAAAGG